MKLNNSCTRQAIGPVIVNSTWKSIHNPPAGPQWNDYRDAVDTSYNCGNLLNEFDSSKKTCGGKWTIHENFSDSSKFPEPEPNKPPGCTVGKGDPPDCKLDACNPLTNGIFPTNFGCTCPYTAQDFGGTSDMPGCIVTPSWNWIIGICQGQTCNGNYNDTKNLQKWKNIGTQLDINYIAAYNYYTESNKWIMANDSSFNIDGK
jgi:hypothetical protein